MQSTYVRQIKAALVDQAFHGTTQISCPLGRVVAVGRWKRQLRVMIRGWSRWYPVESVRIETLFTLPDQCLSQTRGMSVSAPLKEMCGSFPEGFGLSS